MTPTLEYESALRRAFVDRKADYILISNRRQQFQIESANYGVDRGWLYGEWDDRDEQNTIWIGRLTEEGRQHFRLEPQTKPEIRRLDRTRLKALAEESRTWPAYMRAELGVKAPSRIETSLTCRFGEKGQCLAERPK